MKQQLDPQTARDIGTLEGKVDLILENTKKLPDLIAKVERHDTELRFIKAITVASLVAFFTTLGKWVRSYFFSGVK